jgi:monooxygenase
VSTHEHVDVLIIGAGLSGIGAAWRLQHDAPGVSYAILEARAAIGGTWDLFRYPGVRSDSDMFTLSYPFRPWRHRESMAGGKQIRDYIRDTAAEARITEHIRFRTRALTAQWFSADARWTVRTDTGATWSCSFLYVCAGYYAYDRGHQPEFPGREEYAGRFVHPQFWPDDLDVDGTRVVVIGSGATAVTLVPALADQGAHVTMLQRSPSYLTALPRVDAVADRLRKYLPAGLAHSVVRNKNVLVTSAFYQLCRRRPEAAKKLLRAGARRFLDDPAYLDEHFTPTYEPWDQRLCVVPGGDFFRAIRKGRADVVTDRIDTFVPEGVRLESGRTLEADVVVSATGLSLLALGGLELTVDGTRVDVGDTVAYRGVMLSGVPNLAFCFGYTNASWTLRADLSSRFVARLVKHLGEKDLGSATPRAPGPDAPRLPLLDLTSSYVRRAVDRFPRRVEREPWNVRQNYLVDRVVMRAAGVERDMDFAPAAGPG